MSDTASYTWGDHGELVVLSGPVVGSSYPLNEHLTLIGSADDADVRLADAGWEPHECVVVQIPSGLLIRGLCGSNSPVVTKIGPGQCFRVGSVEFQVNLPRGERGESAAEEAYRVQVAAVAAQQAALDEREARILDAHADSEQSLRRRQQNLDAKEAQLSAMQADLDKAIQKMESERARLRDHAPEIVALNGPHRKVDTTSVSLAPAAWREQILKVNTERELENRRLQDGWHSLRQAQERWRTRRNQESAALQVRRTDLDESERRLATARDRLEKEIAAWNRKKIRLEEELFGLDHRILGLRLAMKNQLAQVKNSTESVPPTDWTSRLGDLERISECLHDERLVLTEAWERLARIQTSWEADRDEILADLETWHDELDARRGQLDDRESRIHQREEDLGQREHENEEIRQGLNLVRTRLRQEQVDFQQEQELNREVLRSRQALLEKHWKEMLSLRDRWKNLRDHWQSETRELSTKLNEDRRELQKLKLALNDRLAHVDEEKRLLREKSIAVEQFRVEVLMQSEDPAANDRLTAYRQEWNQQMAGIIKQVNEARTALRKELELLNERKAEYQETLVAAKNEALQVDERELAVSQLETQLRQVMARSEKEVADAGALRRLAEQRVEKLRDQIERVAIDFLDDSTPPQRVEKAA